MNSLFLEKIKELLLKEKNSLLSKSYYDEDIDYSGDETDEIQAKILANINNEIITRNNLKVNKINNSLNKIKDEKYGLCEDCGDEISKKRLLANPYFSTCITCAEQREIDNKKR